MLGEYPFVTARPCKHFNPHFKVFAVTFCEKCNTISFNVPFIKTDEGIKRLEGEMPEILSHETMHWVLFKFISLEACSDLDCIDIEEYMYYKK